jgi:hypothetical protein
VWQVLVVIRNAEVTGVRFVQRKFDTPSPPKFRERCGPGSQGSRGPGVQGSRGPGVQGPRNRQSREGLTGSGLFALFGIFRSPLQIVSVFGVSFLQFRSRGAARGAFVPFRVFAHLKLRFDFEIKSSFQFQVQKIS